MMQPNQGGGLVHSGMSPQSTSAPMMTSTNNSTVVYANQNHYMAAAATGSVTQMQQHQMPIPQPSPPGVRMAQQQHHHQMAQFGMVSGQSPLSGGARPPGQGHFVFVGAQQQQNQSLTSHLVAGQLHQQQIQISQAPSPSGPYTLMNSPQQRNPNQPQQQQQNQSLTSHLVAGQLHQQQIQISQAPSPSGPYTLMNSPQQRNPNQLQQQQQNQSLTSHLVAGQLHQQQIQSSQAPSPSGPYTLMNLPQQRNLNQLQQQQPQIPGFIVHQSAPIQAPILTTQSSNVNLNLNLLSTQSSNASLSGLPLSNQVSQSSTLSGVSTQPAPSTTDFDSPGAPGHPLLTKQRLDDLTREIDPFEQLDDDVKEALLQYADEFIENVANSACQLAKHRKSSTLEVQDVKLTLERNWNMWIPGFGVEDIRPYKKACVTEAHKQRMALIKKTLRKI